MVQLFSSALKRSSQAQWNMIIDEIVFWGIPFLIAVFFVVSLILFIRDGIRAGREGRKRKTYPIVLFVVSLVLFCITAVILIGLVIIAAIAIRSM